MEVRRKMSVLVSANGPDSGVWSKHSSLGISTMRQVQRNKGREWKQQKRDAWDQKDLTVSGVFFYILYLNAV